MMDGFQVQWDSYAEPQSPPPQILMSPGGLGWDHLQVGSSYGTENPRLLADPIAFAKSLFNPRQTSATCSLRTLRVGLARSFT